MDILKYLFLKKNVCQNIWIKWVFILSFTRNRNNIYNLDQIKKNLLQRLNQQINFPKVHERNSSTEILSKYISTLHHLGLNSIRMDRARVQEWQKLMAWSETLRVGDVVVSVWILGCALSLLLHFGPYIKVCFSLGEMG